MSSKNLQKVLITTPGFPKLEMLAEFDTDYWPGDKAIPEEDLLRRVDGIDAMLISNDVKITDEVLEAAGPQLKVLSTKSVGYDHIDVDAVRRRSIRFGNTPSVSADAVAEYTITIMLACSRRIFDGREVIKEGSWLPNSWHLSRMTGIGLKDSVVGIVGMGRIGSEIAKRLVPFKVKEIFYTSRKEKTEILNAKRVELEELLRESDFVIVTSVLCAETFHMIGKEQFAMMKSTAVFVNSSRGDVVDQDALFEALRDGVIRAAALDVTSPEPLPPQHPLLSLPNCYILPHLASNDESTRTAMAEMAGRNIIAGLAGEPMPGQVFL